MNKSDMKRARELLSRQCAKFEDLVERFAARGVNLAPGNMQPSMIRHLLDTVEEQDVRIRGLEDKMLKLRADLGG